MKMRVSKVVLLPVFILFYSVSALSNILDGGEIRFRGFITDDAPKWTWRVASPDQSWDVDTGDAREERGQLIFNLKSRGSIPFLEGHLHEVAERGGPGFTPYVTYSSGAQSLISLDGDNTTRQRFRASIPVRDPENNKNVGNLEFTIEQGMAIAVGVQEEDVPFSPGMFLVSGESLSDVNPDKLSPELMNRLSNLLMMNKKLGIGISATSNKKVISQGMLSDGRVQNIAAAFASALSDFKLYLPSENTPAQWHATLNVTVVVH
ncbi:fimbrial protein [Citrobacter sp. Cpo090]|uniref:F4 family fimbrial subunit n=1 Tax=Citrobacter sp. Cpo090 TaxID=2985139 RepID=UPI0025790F00|nr:fimbrial protein [Citrobacter sp. Cpo090]MDM2845519.1 fimbrial protein [Citrobacter sp. Cpo090]